MNKYNKDLRKSRAAQFNSPLGYGSDFRPTDTLEVLFSRHPNWTRMKNSSENGAAWPLEELEEIKRATDIKKLSPLEITTAPWEIQFSQKIDKEICCTWLCIGSSFEQDWSNPRCTFSTNEDHDTKHNQWTQKNSWKGQAYPRSKLQMELFNIGEQ